MQRVAAEDLAAPLQLLEESLRDGLPVSREFTEQLREELRKGETELLAVYSGENVVGVLMLSYRLNVAAGGSFASIEELHVSPNYQSQGIGSVLLDAAGERCRANGVSYIEVQAEGEIPGFYVALGYEKEETEVLSRAYPL